MLITQPAEALKLFLAIPGERIDRDLAAVAADPTAVGDRVLTYLGRAAEAGPEEQAAALHDGMIHAALASRVPGCPPDVAIYLGGYAAFSVAEVAVEAHMERPAGKLVDLERRMKQIREREGLDEDEGEDWSPGEGPDEYEQLRTQADELAEGVHDVMAEAVLRRYRLASIADLFTRDRAVFDQQFEAGRLSVFSRGREQSPRD